MLNLKILVCFIVTIQLAHVWECSRGVMQVLSRLQTVNNSDGHISQGHAIATESKQGWISHTGVHFHDQDGQKDWPFY